MRGTIHLFTSDDYRALRPVMRPVLERTFGNTTFARAIAGVDLAELAELGGSILAEQARSRSDLRPLLADRWPDRDADSLAAAVNYLVPLVQVPPRGLWTETGRATWTTAEAWLGKQMRGSTVDELVLRYLASFGPATVADASSWSRLTRLREVFERLRPRLRTFRDESGRELFDVPDARVSDPDVPAPLRFLPVYDNIFLGHADRRRITPRSHPPPEAFGSAALLVDGFIGATWTIERNRRAATLVIAPFTRLEKKARVELEEEAQHFVDFIAWDAETTELRFRTAP